MPLTADHRADRDDATRLVLWLAAIGVVLLTALGAAVVLVGPPLLEATDRGLERLGRLGVSREALEEELYVATRDAAVAAERAAAPTAGDYTAGPDLLAVVDATLAAHPAGVRLDRGSTDTYVRWEAFSICVEHPALPGSVIYASGRGGMHTYVATPCP